MGFSWDFIGNSKEFNGISMDFIGISWDSTIAGLSHSVSHPRKQVPAGKRAAGAIIAFAAAITILLLHLLGHRLPQNAHG